MTTDKVDNNREEFNIIGLYAFFNAEDDQNIDWYEFFQLSENEQLYALNNNQIHEVDKIED